MSDEPLNPPKCGQADQRQHQMAVTICLPQTAPLSTAVQTLHDAGVVTCRRADEQLAVIEFDGGTQRQMVDFRPKLPLAVRW